jgi:hypothetical protein
MHDVAAVPGTEADAALEAAITFLRSCAANNWFDAPDGISFFRPKHERAKLDAMYEKNFTKLLRMARKGDVEADHYLRQELSEETDLSPAKREARRWLLLAPVPKRHRGRGRKKVANQDRDFIIAQAVLHATLATGLPATRNAATATAASGASVVAEALRRLKLPPLTERTINRIWGDHVSRARRDEMKTIVVLPKARPVTIK